MHGIADANKPNAGRIYDYLLGGNHNFAVDREAAQKVLQAVPFMPDIMRLIRWFLGEAVRRLSAEGFTHFMDFASGLPTVDHIHQLVGPEGKVIYSDIDPVTVAYGRQILEGAENVVYAECDVAKPEELLDSGVPDELFGGQRRVAIGMNGIAYFLTDEQVEHALDVLYEWSAPGAKLFLCDGDAGVQSETLDRLARLYEQMAQPLYTRSLDRMKELIGKWNIEDPGAQSLENWLDLDTKVNEEVMEVAAGGGFYGVILRK